MLPSSIWRLPILFVSFIKKDIHSTFYKKKIIQIFIFYSYRAQPPISVENTLPITQAIILCSQCSDIISFRLPLYHLCCLIHRIISNFRVRSNILQNWGKLKLFVENRFSIFPTFNHLVKFSLHHTIGNHCNTLFTLLHKC